MPRRYDIKPQRPYPVGTFVLTPTGRVARVIGYLGDDRIDLRYCDSVTTGHAKSWADYWTAKGKAFGIDPKPGEANGDYCRRVQAFAKAKT